MAHILIVEDDKSIVTNLTEFLKTEGFSISAVNGQSKALDLLEQSASEFDLILLDVSLADGNGFAVCRAAKSTTDLPVIFLTASGDEYSVVTGLDLGADDYIIKPFETSELLTRIRTVLRNSRKTEKHKNFSAKGLFIDFDNNVVTVDKVVIHLTQTEFKIVSLLAQNAGKVMPYDKIIKEIWDLEGNTNNRILRVNMVSIRRKLERNSADPQYIFTETGIGYRMVEEDKHII